MVREGTPVLIDDPINPRFGKCEGITVKGLPCRNNMKKGLSVCHVHVAQDKKRMVPSDPHISDKSDDDSEDEKYWRTPSWNPNNATKPELAQILRDENVKYHASSSKDDLVALFHKKFNKITEKPTSSKPKEKTPKTEETTPKSPNILKSFVVPTFSNQTPLRPLKSYVKSTVPATNKSDDIVSCFEHRRDALTNWLAAELAALELEYHYWVQWSQALEGRV